MTLLRKLRCALGWHEWMPWHVENCGNLKIEWLDLKCKHCPAEKPIEYDFE